MKSVFVSVAMAMLMTCLFVSCDRDLYHIKVEPEALHLRSVHEHPMLSATLEDYNGEEINISDIKWLSSDPSVVEINEDGRVSARGNGMATITAKGPTDETEVKVTVTLSQL